ncbi:MAG: hypothetical protein IJX94_01275 [Clostridia bacterium]|nr:hypothetical protein [Clostridia bacterium]
MKIFQKWRASKHRDEVEATIENYNEAVTNLGEAADQLGAMLKKCGIESENITASIERMKELADIALITPEDLQRGGNSNGKR